MVLVDSTCSIPWRSPWSAEVAQSGEREGPPEAEAVEVGVDGDHVDLAEGRVVTGGRVHLGPAEPGQASVAFVEQESVGVEPGLGLGGSQLVGGPAGLVGVPGEGPVVHCEERVVVDTRSEGAQVDRHRVGGRERAANLEHLADEHQPGRGGSLVVLGRRRLGLEADQRTGVVVGLLEHLPTLRDRSPRIGP